MKIKNIAIVLLTFLGIAVFSFYAYSQPWIQPITVTATVSGGCTITPVNTTLSFGTIPFPTPPLPIYTPGPGPGATQTAFTIACTVGTNITSVTGQGSNGAPPPCTTGLGCQGQLDPTPGVFPYIYEYGIGTLGTTTYIGAGLGIPANFEMQASLPGPIPVPGTYNDTITITLS